MGLWERRRDRGRLVALRVLDVRWGSLLELGVVRGRVEASWTMGEGGVLGLEAVVRCWGTASAAEGHGLLRE